MSSTHGKWRWSLAFAAAVAALAGGLALSRNGDSPVTAPPRTAGVTGSLADAPPGVPFANSTATSAKAAATERRAATAPDAVPAGLSVEQWQQMQAALADHPQREAELRRITAFLQLQARVQAFAEARQRGATRGELATLARPLQAELPQHLALGELNAAEALRLQGALLELTEPDTTAAAQALADWRDRYVGRPDGEAPQDPREAAFARAQQTALANWQAGGGRDPQALEHELEVLRSAHFDARR